jgi:hypothetical protein
LVAGAVQAVQDQSQRACGDPRRLSPSEFIDQFFSASICSKLGLSAQSGAAFVSPRVARANLGVTQKKCLVLDNV